jgi:methylenetetrahydrofolate dehydrogenase (NADP+)/methenyltetrahydrofolate cyclohydrolase
MAEVIKSRLREENQNKQQCPQLAMILVGETPENKVYAALKEKAAAAVGAKSHSHILPAEIKKNQVLELIDELNSQNTIDGILLQLPLPDKLQPYRDRFLAAIDPKKDVDGFHPENRGLLMGGRPAFKSCAAQAVLNIIEQYSEAKAKKRVLIVGNSFDLCLPLNLMLLQSGYQVLLQPEFEREALLWCDVAVFEKGCAGMINGSFLSLLSRIQLIIDAGFYYQDTKPRGNVDTASLNGYKGALLPVPGGLGPLLIAQLMVNLTAAGERL